MQKTISPLPARGPFNVARELIVWK